MEERTLNIHLQGKDPARPPIDERSTKKVKVDDQEGGSPVTGMDTDESHQDDKISNSAEATAQKAPSFKGMLVNNGHEHMPREEDFELENGDVSYSLKDGIPAVTFSTRITEILDRSFQFAVIVKLLGRRIRYTTLRDRLPYLWNTTGPYQLIDCAGDCYIVKFSNHHDQQMALLNGPWVVAGRRFEPQN